MFLPDGEFEEELRFEEWLTAEPGDELLKFGAELLEPGAESVLGEKFLSTREGIERKEGERNEEEGKENFDLEDEVVKILSERSLVSDLEEKVLGEDRLERPLSIFKEKDFFSLDEDESEEFERDEGCETLEGKVLIAGIEFLFRSALAWLCRAASGFFNADPERRLSKPGEDILEFESLPVSFDMFPLLDPEIERRISLEGLLDGNDFG
jgi:hypothetical protein